MRQDTNARNRTNDSQNPLDRDMALPNRQSGDRNANYSAAGDGTHNSPASGSSYSTANSSTNHFATPSSTIHSPANGDIDYSPANGSKNYSDFNRNAHASTAHHNASYSFADRNTAPFGSPKPPPEWEPFRPLFWQFLPVLLRWRRAPTHDEPRRRNLLNLRSHHAAIGLVGLILLFAGLTFYRSRPETAAFPDSSCHTPVDDRADNRTPSETWQQLAGREGIAREQVREIVGLPVCTLTRLSVRAGAITERELYRTEGDRQVIVAYEDDRYLGYAFEPVEVKKSWGAPALARERSGPSIKEIELAKTWEARAGETVGKHQIVGGLGDVTVRVGGNITAPASGWIDSDFVLISEGSMSKSTNDCVVFSSAQIPAYLLKLCGLSRRHDGAIARGSVLGRTDAYLHVALLSFRKNADGEGRWMYVSPSTDLVERMLQG